MEPITITPTLAAIAAKFAAFKDRRSILDVFRNKEAQIEALIARHQKALERVRVRRAKEAAKLDGENPFSYARYLEPLAATVLTQFPGMAVRVMGPYGLGNTASITVYDPAKGDTDGVVGWLQFRYDSEDGVLSYVDLNKHTGHYPPGSLGDVNGLNYETVPLTAETTLEELAQLFRRGVSDV